MLDTQYLRPAHLQDAAAAAREGAKFLAGGQTLLASMKLGLAMPPALADLQGIEQLHNITATADSLVAGAMVKHARMATDPIVQRLIPALAGLAGGIGDRQVRAMGTIGGSVANNDPAACYPAALLALDATVHTSKRSIASKEYFQGLFATALEEDEIIANIEFPVPRRAAYVKFRHPASRFALIGVFVADTRSGPRVAVTGSGNGVFRHPGLEAALAQDFSVDAIRHVAVNEKDMGADQHASAAYRAHLLKVVAGRAIAALQDGGQ